ncbi:MAG: thioredoxin domain-containing protein [Hyphomonadaceae bacterium]
MSPSLTFRLAVGAVAAIALAACSGQNGQAGAGTFKPVPVTPIIGDVTLGSETAKVHVVEYAALSCPHCRDFWKWEFPKLKADYIDTGKIKYTYRDYPLEGDPQTGKAVDGLGVLLASVSRCAGKDKYYAMIDEFFTRQYDVMVAAQSGSALPVLNEIGAKNGLTSDQILTCIDHQPELKASIKQSHDDAMLKGVRSTPSVFINDELLPNPTLENIVAAIDAKLGGSAAPAAATTPAPTTPPAPQPQPAAPAPASPPS